MSFNRVFLLGRLGADPELRYTQSQMPVCTMRVATNERRKGADGNWGDHTEWHTVVAFDKTAENCGKFLAKGRQLFVEGKIQTRKYQDQDGKDKFFTEVIANNVTFVGGGKEGGMEVERTSSSPRSNAAPSAASAAASAGAIGETISFDDDDIPF